MTDNDAAASWNVRPGGMLDINPVARLLRHSALAQGSAPTGSTEAIEDSLEAAARLMLLHLVLERGRLVVADQAGEVVAAAVWLPGDARASGEQLRDLLRREVPSGDEPDMFAGAATLSAHTADGMAQLVDDLAITQTELVLYAVVVDERVPLRDLVPLARAVVSPCSGKNAMSWRSPSTNHGLTSWRRSDSERQPEDSR